MSRVLEDNGILDAVVGGRVWCCGSKGSRFVAAVVLMVVVVVVGQIAAGDGGVAVCVSVFVRVVVLAVLAVRAVRAAVAAAWSLLEGAAGPTKGRGQPPRLTRTTLQPKPCALPLLVRIRIRIDALDGSLVHCLPLLEETRRSRKGAQGTVTHSRAPVTATSALQQQTDDPIGRGEETNSNQDQGDEATGAR